jgi:hypothetical protein
MAEPPFESGADQDTVACRSPAVAETPVGARGTLWLCSITRTSPASSATARSGRPSPFMSPMTTEIGPMLVGKLELVKPPLPSPISRVTFMAASSTTARSGLLSPPRSPIAAEIGPPPTEMGE